MGGKEMRNKAKKEPSRLLKKKPTFAGGKKNKSHGAVERQTATSSLHQGREKKKKKKAKGAL